MCRGERSATILVSGFLFVSKYRISTSHLWVHLVYKPHTAQGKHLRVSLQKNVREVLQWHQLLLLYVLPGVVNRQRA